MNFLESQAAAMAVMTINHIDMGGNTDFDPLLDDQWVDLITLPVEGGKIALDKFQIKVDDAHGSELFSLQIMSGATVIQEVVDYALNGNAYTFFFAQSSGTPTYKEALGIQDSILIDGDLTIRAKRSHYQDANDSYNFSYELRRFD